MRESSLACLTVESLPVKREPADSPADRSIARPHGAYAEEDGMSLSEGESFRRYDGDANSGGNARARPRTGGYDYE